MKKLSLIGILSVLALGCGEDDGPGDSDSGVVRDGGSGSRDDGGTNVLRRVEGDFRGPESAVWDNAARVWYVSNFGQPLDLSGATPDEPAYVTRLSEEGAVLDARFVAIDGDLLGLAVLDGTLYASRASELVAIDLATREVRSISVPDAAFLNDVAVGGGAVYVSDTGNGRILRYVPGGTVEVLSSDPALAAVNGLLVEPSSVVAVTLGAFPPDAARPGGVYRVADDGSVSRIGTVSGAFDGIEADGDSYLVSDFAGTLWRVERSGATERLFDGAAAGMSSMADIGFDSERRRVLIPDLVGSQVYVLDL